MSEGGEKISVSLKELTAICQKVTGNKVNIAEIEEDRQADIRIYISDHSLVSSVTGWHPTKNVESIVTDIYHWIKNNEALLKPILIG
jgi:CDP-paratose 2-epimerase